MKKDFRISVLILLLVAFACVAFLVKTGAFATANNAVSSFVYERRSTVLTVFMVAASAAGEWFIYVPIILLLLSFKRTQRAGLTSGMALLVSFLLNETLKALFKIDRPDTSRLTEVSGYGFPSGHAMNSTVFVSVLTFLLLRSIKKGKKAGIAAWVLAALTVLTISISRIYLGVHTLADLLGGYFMGGFLALGSMLLIERMENKNKKDIGAQ